MVDNVQITAANSATATIASDDVGGGVQIQRVRLDTGAEGTSTPVNYDNPLSVEINSDPGLVLLRRIAKAMDSLQTVDSAQRQRVTIDAGTLPNVTTVNMINTVSTVSSVSAVGAANVATLANVDARFQFIDSARTAYNTGIRANLIYS